MVIRDTQGQRDCFRAELSICHRILMPWRALLLLFLVVWAIGGCQDRVHLTDSSALDLTTPEAVLAGFDMASLERDYAKMLAYIAPERREQYARFYRSTERYAAKLKELEKAVCEEIGSDEARTLRSAIGRYPNPGFSLGTRSGGRIDRNKVAIIVESEDGIARIDDRQGGQVAVLEKRGSQWHIETYAGGLCPEESLGAYQSMVSGLCRVVDEAIRDVRLGMVNKVTFIQFLEERFEWEPGEAGL